MKLGSHIALEAQHDMAGAQYDVARSFYSLLGSFGAFGLEPRRVGSSTRHGGGHNATWRGPNTTWRTLLALFWAVLAPLGWSHVALEPQHDMVGSQYDMAHAFDSLLGCFGAFELELRRVGAPTRHGEGPIRRGARFWLTFGLFCRL